MDNYICEQCNYTTKKQGNLNRHLKSIKHIKNVKMNTIPTIVHTNSKNNQNMYTQLTPHGHLTDTSRTP